MCPRENHTIIPHPTPPIRRYKDDLQSEDTHTQSPDTVTEYRVLTL